MSVLTLAAAKTHLNISATTYDVELQGFIDAAESAIAQRCGALAATAVTERVVARCGVTLLSSLPVISLASATLVGGAAASITDVTLLGPSGVVRGLADGTYDVVYQAGRSTVPPDLLFAVKELVRHLWDTQRGPTRRPGSTASDAAANTVPGAAYLLPFRVLELIAPYMQPGFA